MIQSIISLVISALITTIIIVLFRQRFIPYWRNIVSRQSPKKRDNYRIREVKSRKWRWGMQISMWCLPYIDTEYIDWAKQKKKENLKMTIPRNSGDIMRDNLATHYPAFLSELSDVQFKDMMANEWKTHNSFVKELPLHPSDFQKYRMKVHKHTDAKYIEGMASYAYWQRILYGFSEREAPEQVARSFDAYLREWKVDEGMHALPIIGGDSEFTQRIRFIKNDDDTIESQIIFQFRPLYKIEIKSETIERYPDGRRKPSKLMQPPPPYIGNFGRHRIKG